MNNKSNNWLEEANWDLEMQEFFLKVQDSIL